MENKNRQIEVLDFYRGVAILLIFSYHIWIIIFPNFQHINYNNTLKTILIKYSPPAFGGVGVSLFLVISGFLIHWSYLINKEKFNVGVFFNKRFWRIWPPYFLALCLFFIYPRNYYSTNDLFSHIFLAHNLYDDYFFSINPSFWSLALEMQLYLLYPLFLFLRNKLGMNTTTILVFLISVLIKALGYFLEIKSIAYNNSVFYYWIVWIGGAFLAEKFFQDKRMFSINIWLIFLAPLIAVVLRKTMINTYVWLLLFLILIDFSLHNPYKPKKIYLQLFNTISFIGICSYSMYLFHQPLLEPLIILLTGWFYSKLLSILLVILLIVLLSYYSYKFIELPSVTFGKKFYYKINLNKIRRFKV